MQNISTGKKEIVMKPLFFIFFFFILNVHWLAVFSALQQIKVKEKTKLLPIKDFMLLLHWCGIVALMAFFFTGKLFSQTYEWHLWLIDTVKVTRAKLYNCDGLNCVFDLISFDVYLRWRYFIFKGSTPMKQLSAVSLAVNMWTIQFAMLIYLNVIM